MRLRKRSQLRQSCEEYILITRNPGFQSKPWAEISERFQRYSLFVSFNSWTLLDPVVPLQLKTFQDVHL